MELFDRERLAGKAPLADEEVFGGEHPHVARDHVAGGQLDDVAGHQVPQRHLFRGAVPNDRGGHVDHGLELRRRRVRPGLLQEAERDAEHHHDRHHGSGARVAGGEGNRRRVASRITSGLRMIFSRRMSQPCWRSCATSFGPAVRRALFGLRLRQARRSRPQRLEQIFAVLLGCIEHGGRNMNVLTLDLWEERLLLGACRWPGRLADALRV